MMPKLKICGLTRLEDVELCQNLGVDFTGFIFVPGSPRRVEPEFVAGLPREHSQRVGVFAGADASEVLSVARLAKLDFVQVHGGEGPEYCRLLGASRVIKVLWPERLEQDALRVELERFAPCCAYFLLDAGQSGGGSGQPLNLEKLRGLHPPKPWFLAGGLGPQNLAETLRMLPENPPDGLDLNSALESAPGQKNHERVRLAASIVFGHPRTASPPRKEFSQCKAPPPHTLQGSSA